MGKLAWWVVVVAACTPQLPRDRSSLSSDLTRRTGGALRTGSSRAPYVPSDIDLGALSADDAVALALWNNPRFQADLNDLEVARGNLVDAGTLPNPTLLILFPLGTKQLEITGRQTLGALWQRPRRIEAASEQAAAVAEQLVQRGLDLARDVTLAHAEVVAAQDRLALAREGATIWDQLATIAADRARLGDASTRERDAARADAVTSRLAITRAQLAVDAAVLALRELLGLALGTELVVQRADLAVTTSIDAWLTRARTGRPDLRAADHTIAAAAARAGVERSRIFEVVGLVDFNGNGSELGPGLDLVLPIFDRRQGPRIREAAELERAVWAKAALMLTIDREVASAHARLVAATSLRTALTTDVVPTRQATVALALSAYEQGEESQLVVLEAARAVVDARLQLVDAVAEQARAQAELTRAAGGRP